MVHIDENGQVIGGNRTAVNAAGFMIHSAVHKARPDVDAACHAHSKYGKAWSAFGRPLDIINQDACRFWNNHSVYSSYGGVALQDEEGVRIAESLGPEHRAVILQNHGLLTAGGTVDEAAYLYTIMERSCEIQLMVEATGLEKKHISDEEAAYTYKYEGNAVRCLHFAYVDAILTGSRRRFIPSFSPTFNMKLPCPTASWMVA